MLDDDQDPAPRAWFDRTPPNDQDAEQSALGGQLLSKDAIGDVVEILNPTDFYKPAHETIQAAIVDMFGRGEPVDPITVGAELTKRGEITRIGGASYLHTLVQAVPTAANASYYAEIVAGTAKLRRLAEAGTKIANMAYAGEGDADAIADAAGAEFNAAVSVREQSTSFRPGDRSAALLDRLEARGRGEITKGVPTGFTDLDNLTNGLHGGQMIVVAARPAMGKSTLAVDFVRAASIKHGKTSALFTLEMSGDEVHERILSAEARVALHHMRSGTLTDDDWNRISRRLPAIDAAPIHIFDDPGQTVLQIKAQARRLQQRHGLALVVVDYLQLLQHGGRRAENRQTEVSEMSRQLKLMAKELDVPVVVVAQLNRGPEQRTDKKPVVSDLRESGAIEQDADMVILIHREDAYEKESPRAGEADLIVGKHRNGPTATITVAFQGHYSRFVDMAQT
ncbi:replicative DNA helicase [Streptomyces sp. NPDC059810]|uniref:replicative DNA helicase n=1 Tax=Streptomyces sp. NPDC059810 TaxID=3346956 RepID=UPI003646DA52